MTIFNSVRDRLSPRGASPEPDVEVEGSGHDAPLPFAGYDRLNDREAVDGLSDHSQVELEAVDSYERANKNRVRVLDKLRYLRGSEPFPGYDALSVEQVSTALEDADLATVKKVRGYERKFANRRDVLDDVARVQHERQAAAPAATAPAYQSASAASV